MGIPLHNSRSACVDATILKEGGVYGEGQGILVGTACVIVAKSGPLLLCSAALYVPCSPFISFMCSASHP